MALIRNMSFLVVAFPVFAGVILLFTGKRHSKLIPGTAFFISLVTMALVFVLSLQNYHNPVGVVTSARWFDNVTFGFKFDDLAAVMLLIINFISAAALFFAQDYFKKYEDDYYFIFSNMLIFLGGMNGVILSIDTIQFYFFYEMMLIPSYLILAFYGESEQRKYVSVKYFIFTHVGAVLLLVPFLMFYSINSATNFDAIASTIAALKSGPAELAFGLLFLGFAFKMAIFPFHTWLPDTYTEAPLPLTVMLAGGMINTGIYGMARFLFMFPAEVTSVFAYAMMAMAVITQFYGGLMALAETEIKKIIAYSSISQMGYVLFGFSSVIKIGYMGSVFHALNHGLAKGLLFIVAGTVVLVTGKKLITEVSGLGSRYHGLGVCATIGALALLGAPPLSGFTSEWMIFAGGFSTHFKELAVLSAIATAITTGYSLYFVKRIFYGKLDESIAKEDIPFRMRVTMGIIAAFVLAIGVFPAFVTKLVYGAAAVLKL